MTDCLIISRDENVYLVTGVETNSIDFKDTDKNPVIRIDSYNEPKLLIPYDNIETIVFTNTGDPSVFPLFYDTHLHERVKVVLSKAKEKEYADL